MAESVPSVPPNVTAPMVWYRFVKELPSTLMVVGGTVIAMAIVIRAPGSAIETVLSAIGAIVAPAAVAALGRSRPAEP